MFQFFITNTPLDQFDIVKLCHASSFLFFEVYYHLVLNGSWYWFFWYYFGEFWSIIVNFFLLNTISNVVLFASYIFYVIGFIFYNYILYNEVLPKFYQILSENIVFFVRGLILENVGTSELVYFIYIFLIMLFVLLSNLIGLIPFAFTITSHLAVTFILAYISFFGLNLIGFLAHGFAFFSLFLPNGAPLMIAPFLVVIEIISYIARVFSLSIRLFANMMSGHTLLKILSSFSWNLFCFFTIGSLIFFIPSLIVVAVMGLECAIAILQAYVFCILLCLYFHDAIYLH